MKIQLFTFIRLLIFGSLFFSNCFAVDLFSSEKTSSEILDFKQFQKFAYFSPDVQRYELKYIILLDGPEGTPVSSIFLSPQHYLHHEDFLKDRDNLEIIQSWGLSGKEVFPLEYGNRQVLKGSLFWQPNLEFYFDIYSSRLKDFAKDIIINFNQLKKTLPFLQNNLRYLIYRPQRKLLNESRVSFDENLILGSLDILTTNFEVYFPGETLGILKKFSSDELAEAITNGVDLSRYILLLSHLPEELPDVMGIITTIQQPHLSHLALLSKNRKTLNFYTNYKQDISKIYKLLNQPVRLRTISNEIRIKSATLKEIEEFWQEKNKKRQISIDYPTYRHPGEMIYDLKNKKLPPVGNKAKNYSWLLINQKMAPSFLVRDALAIPTFFFQNFLKENSLMVQVKEIMQKIKNKTITKISGLGEIKKKINQTKVDQNFLRGISKGIRGKYPDLSPTARIRFRSSSNVEDLSSFSAAGVFDSTWTCLADWSSTAKKSLCDNKSHKKRHDLEYTVKKIWSSAFSLSAFSEMSDYGIDPSKTSMGILIHLAFAKESFNGVILTANPHSLQNDGTVYWNIFPEEIEITDGDLITVPEIHMVKNEKWSGALSSLHPFKYIVSKEKIQLLSKELLVIKSEFLYDTKHQDERTSIDMEFKGYIDDNGKTRFFLKQIRPFNTLVRSER